MIRASRNMTTATLQPLLTLGACGASTVWRRRTTPPSWAMRSAVRHRRQWRHRSPAQTSDSSSQTVESTMGGGGCAVTAPGDHSTTIAKGSASSDHWLSDQEIADARHDTSATQPISTRVTPAAATVSRVQLARHLVWRSERRGLLRARHRAGASAGDVPSGPGTYSITPGFLSGNEDRKRPVRSSTSVTVSGCSRSPRERSRSRSSIRAASPGRSRWSSSSRSPAAPPASGAGDVRVPVPGGALPGGMISRFLPPTSVRQPLGMPVGMMATFHTTLRGFRGRTTDRLARRADSCIGCQANGRRRRCTSSTPRCPR